MHRPKFKRGDQVSIIGYKTNARVANEPYQKNGVWYYRLNIGMNCAESLLIKSEETTTIIPKAG